MSIIALKATNIILCRTNQTNQNDILKKTFNLFWIIFSFLKEPHWHHRHLLNLRLNVNDG